MLPMKANVSRSCRPPPSRTLTNSSSPSGLAALGRNPTVRFRVTEVEKQALAAPSPLAGPNRPASGIRAAEQVVEAADPEPTITVRLHQDAVRAIRIRRAVVIAEQIDKRPAGLRPQAYL